MLIRWATKEDIPAWLGLSREYDTYISQIATDFSKWYLGFEEYFNRKIEQYGAVMAVDRMSGNCNGAIAFSRSHNRNTFFAVSPKAKRKETAEKLLKVAVRQLNSNQDIILHIADGKDGILKDDIDFFKDNGFEIIHGMVLDGCPMLELVRKADNEKRPKSFHYNYPKFKKYEQKEFCPPCCAGSMPAGSEDIAELEYSWAKL